MISIGTRGGGPKDTLRNIIETKEFVVNGVTPDFVGAVAQSSANYPSGQSEARLLGVELAPSVRVSVPRVAGAAISLECSLERLIPLNDSSRHNLVIGRVLCFRVNEKILKDGRVDVEKYLPAGRLGGPFYATLSDVMRVDVREVSANKSSPEVDR